METKTDPAYDYDKAAADALGMTVAEYRRAEARDLARAQRRADARRDAQYRWAGDYDQP